VKKAVHLRVVVCQRQVHSASSRKLSVLTSIAAGSAAAQLSHSPLFVEARGYLQPAVDFYSRAVAAADRIRTLSGELLAKVSPSIQAHEKVV
jgi:hypothetical protein